MLYSELKENEIWQVLSNDYIIYDELKKGNIIESLEGINDKDIIIETPYITSSSNYIEYYCISFNTIWITNADKNNLTSIFRFKVKPKQFSIENPNINNSFYPYIKPYPKQLSKGYTNLCLTW